VAVVVVIVVIAVIGGVIILGTRAPEVPAKEYDLKVAFAVEVPDEDKAWGEINHKAMEIAKSYWEAKGYKILIEYNFLIPPPELGKLGDTYAAKGFNLYYVPCVGHGPEMWYAAKAHPEMYMHYMAALLEGDLIPAGLPESEKYIPKNLVVSTQTAFLNQHYLLGMIAGGMTKTNKIGFIGGIDYPSIKMKIRAMQEGVLRVNPKADVSNVVWAGSWTDIAAGKEIAASLHEAGCDVIMAYADGVQVGAFTYAKEVGMLGFATMYPQEEIFPDTVVASGVENEANMAISIFGYILEGKFDEIGGQWVEYDYSKGKFLPHEPMGPTINPKFKDKIPKWVLDQVETVKNQIAQGLFKVPQIPETL
jgi:hypothetical protein